MTEFSVGNRVRTPMRGEGVIVSVPSLDTDLYGVQLLSPTGAVLGVVNFTGDELELLVP